jgi:predicted Mrr-cat superfamily restriction endonuclease
VFVNFTTADKQEMKHVKILKLKKNRLSEPLLQYLRANLIASFRKTHGSVANDFHKRLLVSAPVDIDFELFILKTGMDLVGNMLKDKFPTKLEDD